VLTRTGKAANAATTNPTRPQKKLNPRTTIVFINRRMAMLAAFEQRQNSCCSNETQCAHSECLFAANRSNTNRGVISDLKRVVVFGFAIGAISLMIVGCKTSKPKPVFQEMPTAQVPPSPVSPPADTNQYPEQVSHPRPPADAADNMASNILAWDAVEKEYHAKIGETNAPFTFALTNVSPERVMIFDTSTTCDCTVAQLPSKPWTLQPGASGEIHASLDLHGKKTDAVTNYVIVFTSKGNRLLTVKATLPKK
jgi:hypothetical protein